MIFRFSLLFALSLMLSSLAYAQSYTVDIARDSARSDKRTGGRIQKAVLVPGDPDIRISINLPAFQMTLWQNGKAPVPGIRGKVDTNLFNGTDLEPLRIMNNL